MERREKTISMDLQTYKEDMAFEYNRGVRECQRRVGQILIALNEKDFSELFCLLTEEFEDNRELETLIEKLGLTEQFKKQWESL